MKSQALLALVLAGPLVWAAGPNPDRDPPFLDADQPAQERAIAAITKLHGLIQTDGNTPGRPVVRVDLVCQPQVTDDWVRLLQDLPHLRSLSLIGTEVSDAGLARLQGLTELTDLSLNETRITGLGLFYLQKMTQLRGLGLGDLEITDAGLAHLEGLTELRELYLQDTKVTDAGLAHLQGLKKLEVLDLAFTPVTGPGLKHLLRLSNLKRLNLDGCKLTDGSLHHLEELSHLREVNLGSSRSRRAETSTSLAGGAYRPLRGRRPIGPRPRFSSPPVGLPSLSPLYPPRTLALLASAQSPGGSGKKPGLSGYQPLGHPAYNTFVERL